MVTSQTIPPVPDISQRGVRWHRWRVAGSALGVVLVILAIWLVASHAGQLSSAWASLRDPDPKTLLVFVGSILASIPVTAAVQQLMLYRMSGARVNLWEMSGLISVATLLNMLPLWPGAIGRIGYHRVVHGVHPVRAGMAIVASRLLACGAGAALLAGAWIIADDGIRVLIAGWVVSWVALLMLSCWPRLRLASLAAALVWLDMLITTARYMAAFRLLGTTLSAETAAAVAGVSVVASSIPFLGSGPGLREWTVGWMASRLDYLPDALVIGVMADLLVRAATLILLLPIGSISLRWLGRNLRAAVAASRSTEAVMPTPGQSPDHAP